MKTRLLLFLVLLVAAFLRLYRIESHTEFLADQGSAGVVIYEWYKTGQAPLVGPTVSTGQRPGPAYYYIIALPFILSGFNPVVPAVFFAFLGVATVYLLFAIGKALWSEHAGLLSALIYAVSPILVIQNRTMWNPTLVPFFVTLLLYGLSRKWYWLIALCAGFLIQLHYSNIFTLGFLLLFWSYYLITRPKDRSKLIWSIMFFILPLLPFFVYEFQHELVDIRSLIYSMFFSDVPKDQSFFYLFYDISSRLTRLIVPIRNQTVLFGLFVICLLFLFRKRDKFLDFFTLFLVTGIVFASSTSRTIYDHYIYFLYPFPFIMAGVLCATRRVGVLVLFSIALLNLTKTDIFSGGVNDIVKTRNVARYIMEESSEKPFSFTVIASRSFSDYHYRFFFRLADVNPEPIVSKTYGTLFLICEKGDCPSGEELARRSVLDVMCYDHHCKGEYPKLFLDDFSFLKSQVISSVMLYEFRRKTVEAQRL